MKLSIHLLALVLSGITFALPNAESNAVATGLVGLACNYNLSNPSNQQRIANLTTKPSPPGLPSPAKSLLAMT